MPIYNVDVTARMLLVVVADDEAHAREVAFANRKLAFSDADPEEMCCVTGVVRSHQDLREGWDGVCVPYGHDGHTRLNDMLTRSK